MAGDEFALKIGKELEYFASWAISRDTLSEKPSTITPEMPQLVPGTPSCLYGASQLIPDVSYPVYKGDSPHQRTCFCNLIRSLILAMHLYPYVSEDSAGVTRHPHVPAVCRPHQTSFPLHNFSQDLECDLQRHFP